MPEFVSTTAPGLNATHDTQPEGPGMFWGALMCLDLSLGSLHMHKTEWGEIAVTKEVKCDP